MNNLRENNFYTFDMMKSLLEKFTLNTTQQIALSFTNQITCLKMTRNIPLNFQFC